MVITSHLLSFPIKNSGDYVYLPPVLWDLSVMPEVESIIANDSMITVAHPLTPAVLQGDFHLGATDMHTSTLTEYIH